MHKQLIKLIELYYEYGPNLTGKYKNEDELFKIYLLMIKEKDIIKNDTRLKSIFLYLDPIFSKKLKDIKYVNKGIDLYNNNIEYTESNTRIYLFDQKDMDDIKEYQINPYSGRIISKTFFNKYFPDTVYTGYNIGNVCSNPDEKHLDVVKEWVKKFKVSYMYQLYHRYDSYILGELLKYRECKTYKVYRGVHFNENNIDKISDFFNLENNDEYIYKSDNFSSWSLDKNVAYGFLNYRNRTDFFGFIMSTVVDYNDVLIDVNFFNKKINGREDYEKEIILLPGNYKTKLSYVRNIKNQEIFNTFVDIYHFFKLENYLLNEDLIISNGNVFLKIENDLKSIYIYFEKDYNLVFSYKEKTYTLEPYETFKIDFKYPNDVFIFLKQNIGTIKSLYENYTYKSKINFYIHDYLNPYKYKKLEIDEDSFEYPKILNGYYVKNIEDIEIESYLDLSKYLTNYYDEFKKNPNILNLFVLYLRYIDLLYTHFNLLKKSAMEKTMKKIKFYENLFISDKNTYNLYTTLYESHIKPLEDKINEILNKL